MSRLNCWAATLAPYDARGAVDVSRIPEQADHLKSIGVSGAFVNGTTGEFPFLSVDERRRILEAWMPHRTDDFHVGVQVGGLNLEKSAFLAAHAADHGVDLISSTAPYYGQATSVGHIVDWLAQTASAAPDTPFCYYQIPSMTGVSHRPSEILALSAQRIPTLTSVKFTDEDFMELDAIQRLQPRIGLFFGRDELLPQALAVGADSAIGSLYNGLAPIAHAAVDAFDRGETERAYELHRPFRDIARVATGPGFVKELMNRLGPDVGPARGVWGPVGAAERDEIERLAGELTIALRDLRQGVGASYAQ